MNASGTCELRDTGDAGLDIGWRDHHQVGELVDDADDVRQLFLRHLKSIIIARYFHVTHGSALFRSHIGIHGLGLGLLFLVLHQLSVEACDIADIGLGKDLVAVLHLGNQPLQRARHLLGLGHHRDQHVRQRIIHLHFDHLRIDHNET